MKRRYSVPIVVGGTGATSIPKLYLEKTDADIIVIGEGEETSKELFYSLENSKDLSSVAGIWYKKNNKIAYTQQRPLIENIDTIPYPAWDLFPTELYIGRGRFHPVIFRRQFSISTVRGCPFKCVYCYHCFQGHKPRFRSPGSIIEEIKVLKERYKVQYFAFADDLFVANRKRVFEFCKQIKEEDMDVKWGTSARVNLVDYKLLKEMASAGCIFLSYGVESASQKILDNMNKRVTVNQAQNAINLTRKAGIKFHGSFMIGMVGETENTIRETVKFIKKNDIDFQGFFFTTPFPDTELWDYAKQNGLIPDDESLILKYGEMSENLLVNLTDFSDQELISLKEVAEKDIKLAYFRKHMLRAIFIFIKNLVNYLRMWGFKRTAKKSLDIWRFRKWAQLPIY